jgi:hypothetical protein
MRGRYVPRRAIADSDLDLRTRLMVQLAAMIASRALADFRVIAGAALTVALTPAELKEIVYQAVPYVGMAKVIDFLHATNELLAERGVPLPVPGQSTTTQDTRLERGLAVHKQIVGSDQVDAMCDNAPRTRSTFSDTCRRTALAITSPVAASTSPTASCSPSPCSSPSAAPTPRSRDTSPATSTSATTAPYWSACSRSSCRSWATPHLNGLAALNLVTRSCAPTKGSPTTPRIWLITAVSSGFGSELITILLQRGDRVVCTVRDPAKVADLVDSTRTLSPLRCWR